MQQHSTQRVIRSTLLTPIIVFLLSLVGPAVILGFSLVLGGSQDYLSSRLYLFGTLGQALMDFPAIVMFARGNGKWLGHKHDDVRSIGVGLVCAAVLAAVRVVVARRLVFMGGVPAFTQSLTLAWPWSMISATAAILAYGPGEAIYVVYFVTAFDAAFGNQPRLMSAGVIITALLWGLSHSWNISFFGWGALINALLMVGIGLTIGLLFKGTRSSFGPIIFWSLVNGTSA